MAVSITQRPADFAPVNNPVIYKFATTGGPFTNYRIEIEVFAGGVSVGAIFSFTPNSSNVTTADISAILKSILYRDWSLPSGVNESEDSVGSTEFYIKYQELYTGSATSQSSDSSNTKIGVLSALQIGSDADLDLYVPGDSTKKFLTKFDIPKLWSGYPFTLSFLYSNNLYTSYLVLNELNSDGSIILTDEISLDSGEDNALNRIILPEPNDLTKKIEISIAEDIYSVAPTSFTDGADAFTKSSTSFSKTGMFGTPITYSATYEISVPNGSIPKNLNLNTIITIGTGTLNITISYRNATNQTIFISSNNSLTTMSGNMLYTFVPFIDNGPITNIRISASNLGGFGSDVQIDFPAGILLFEDVSVSETKTIQVESACKNPVYLFWKNSLGGDSFWMFDVNQEYTKNYSNGKKNTRMVLYADGLTFNQFESIDELNTPGNIFDVPLIELTTDVDKTEKKTDQQVYVMQPDGSKVGVVVITNPASTRTKRRRHFIEIEIEFPETFL